MHPNFRSIFKKMSIRLKFRTKKDSCENVVHKICITTINFYFLNLSLNIYTRLLLPDSSNERDPEKFSGSDSESDEENLSEEMIRQMLKLKLNNGQMPVKKETPKVSHFVPCLPTLSSP